MRRLLTLLLISITLFGFTSCEDSYETETLNPETRTILVYFPWSGTENGSSSSLYNNVKQNLDSIKSAIGKMTGLANNRVIVFINENAKEAHMYEVHYRRGL